MLTDPYCSHVLYHLAACNDTSVTVEEVARAIAASKTGYQPSTLLATEYKDVQQTLQHRRLPQLHEFNLLRFNSKQGEIRPQPPWIYHLLIVVGHLINRLRSVPTVDGGDTRGLQRVRRFP